MKKNKLIPSLALATLCFLGTETLHATPTTDNMILATRCFRISHILQTLIPEQTEEFCKEKLKIATVEAQLLGQFIMLNKMGAIQSLNEATFLSSDKEMTSCVKGDTINSLQQEIKYIALAVFH